MKMARAFFALFVIGNALFPCAVPAEQGTPKFDFLLGVTQQDHEMNWWFSVPAQFAPKLTGTSEVTKGEYFKIIPIFRNYGISSANEVNITYDLEIRKPDGTIDESEKKVPGYKGQRPGPYLLPAVGISVVCFDPEDPYGEYTIQVSAFDHIADQKAHQTTTIQLKEFRLKETPPDVAGWILSYPSQPKPSLALSAFIRPSRPYLDDKGHPVWSALWFYRHIYIENAFLIPPTIEFYKTDADCHQQRDIGLLFYLLDALEALPVQNGFETYIDDLKEIHIPDPYQEIVSGDQLDMLWAEFYATSRIRPVRQIMTALNLSVHLGTLDKIKTGKLEKTSESQQKAMREAVFHSAVWSIMSNCRQSNLLFQYCVGLYASEGLTETEKGYLGAILKKISGKTQKPNESSIKPDG